jgi:hypothetical protein
LYGITAQEEFQPVLASHHVPGFLDMSSKESWVEVVWASSIALET